MSINRNDYMREYMRKRRQEKGSHVRKVERDYMKRLRTEVFDLLGSRCFNCHCDVLSILEINHINGKGCEERKRIGYKGIYRRALKHPNEYNILCRVCNALHYVQNLLGVQGHQVKWKSRGVKLIR